MKQEVLMEALHDAYEKTKMEALMLQQEVEKCKEENKEMAAALLATSTAGEDRKEPKTSSKGKRK